MPCQVKVLLAEVGCVDADQAFPMSNASAHCEVFDSRVALASSGTALRPIPLHHARPLHAPVRRVLTACRFSSHRREVSITLEDARGRREGTIRHRPFPPPPPTPPPPPPPP